MSTLQPNHHYSIALSLVGNALLLLSIVIFAIGFFPYKPLISGTNEFSISSMTPMPLSQPFDKIIFMVVDALRSDFVYSNRSSFTFVQSLIRQGAALPFTAHASSPTITMPKIKAITTGSVPSFLDVILNFAESDTTSVLSHTDTWLSQLRRVPQGDLIMHGDDTWLKLFPNLFKRADGTSSFFVSDFTEVDDNVTRHIVPELENTDWNGWFMHYLGLDHIGHKSGPQSPFMAPKQREMDKIVQQLYHGIIAKDHLKSTLIILCGDHGMNDAGNHGGSGPGETSPALLFISPKLAAVCNEQQSPATAISDFEYYATVEQADIAATVSALLGLPIPMNNIGVIIPSLLGLWDDRSERLHLLEHNVLQVHNIVTRSMDDRLFTGETLRNVNCTIATSDIEHLQCGYLALDKVFGDYQLRNDALYKYLYTAQRLLSTVASNYNMRLLGVGVVMTSISIASHVFALTRFSRTLCDNCGSVVISLIIFLHGATVFASSYVEEEQQFWYWLSGLFSIYIFILRPYRFKISQQNLISCFCVTLILRVARRWNQTGQKFSGNSDISNSFLQKHYILLWACVLMTHVHLGLQMRSLKESVRESRLTIILQVWLNLATVIFRACFTSADAPELMGSLAAYLQAFATPSWLMIQARIIYILISILICSIILEPKLGGRRSHPEIVSRNRSYPLASEKVKHLRYILTFFLILESRVKNVPIFFFADLVTTILEAAMIQSSVWSAHELSAIIIVLQHTFFFSFGGSNAISSVDLSNAYNGVSGFNIIAVGLLTFVSNWAGPIWWALACASLMRLCKDEDQVFARYSHTMGLFVCGSSLATMLACIMLRTHLFIWTVFSPKYLYTIAWSVGQHTIINNFLVWSFDRV